MIYLMVVINKLRGISTSTFRRHYMLSVHTHDIVHARVIIAEEMCTHPLPAQVRRATHPGSPQLGVCDGIVHHGGHPSHHP